MLLGSVLLGLVDVEFVDSLLADVPSVVRAVLADPAGFDALSAPAEEEPSAEEFTDDPMVLCRPAELLVSSAAEGVVLASSAGGRAMSTAASADLISTSATARIVTSVSNPAAARNVGTIRRPAPTAITPPHLMSSPLGVACDQLATPSRAHGAETHPIWAAVARRPPVPGNSAARRSLDR
jgi:hypothetical protein